MEQLLTLELYADEIIKSINNFKIKENGIQDK